MDKILIIDGHAFAFKAYYAFQAANLKNSITGEPSGAVFGFFRMLFKVLHDFSANYLILAFDPGTPLERNKLYPEYKANRKPTPEDLKAQVTKILEISQKMGFKILQIEGHEADDIIGSIVEGFHSKVDEILIFSGDKDMYQLLGKPNIKMLRSSKGVSEFAMIDQHSVPEIIGVPHFKVTNFMGIVGDSSDNIPGVKGIGEKGAASLFSEFKDLEDIYNNLDKIKSKSIKEKLIQYKSDAFLSRELATIKTDLKLNISLEDIRLIDYLNKDKIAIFKEEGLNALYRDLSKQAGISYENSPVVTAQETKAVEVKIESFDPSKVSYKLVYDLEELKQIVKELYQYPKICVDTETTSVESVKADLLGISLCAKEGVAYYIPIKYPLSLFNNKSISLEDAIYELKGILEDPKILKIGQNIKYDIIVLKNHGINLQGVYFDTMIASYILQPEGRRHNMDDLSYDYLHYKTITYSDLTGTGKKKKNLYEVDVQRVSDYSCEDADITLQLFRFFENKIPANNSQKVFFGVEMPLISVLVDMESKGVKIDVPYFQKLSKEFEDKIKSLEDSIYNAANKKFNIASTKELQTVLFEDLMLPAEKKTLTGFSTDHEVMESLVGAHPIIEFLLDYRKYTKLKSTYLDALPNLVYPKTGRIHTSYNQTIAATGRLSSTDPNLQNIPIKDKEGKQIRIGFIPENKNYSILSLDYSQIELRIMAHFSNDKNMIQAYKENQDIHTATASAIFSVPQNKVTPEMRNKAKAVNFSVIYGVTPFGLSNNLKISRSEAKNFIDRYFDNYPGVKKFIEDISKSAEENKFVETLIGRKRYISGISSSRKQDSEAAKRIAVNSPIQGTSADMIKLAMIQIHSEMKKNQMKSHLIMQVHDELVFEVEESEKEKLFSLAKNLMENVIQLNVPIVVQGKFGNNWDEAH